MKKTYLAAAALSALSLTVPAGAQGWNADRVNAQPLQQLQVRIDSGAQSGAISRRDAASLRTQLHQLTQLEQQYSRRGFSDRESRTLRQRSRALSDKIVRAQRTGRFDWDRPSEWETSPGRRDEAGMNSRFERGNRGDRFNGDARVGQRISARMTDMPPRYRTEYADTTNVYYRYDADRIYQVDRATNLILRMVDVTN